MAHSEARDAPLTTERQFRVVTPKQYQEGYLELRGILAQRRPFQLVRKSEDGNYIVKEPTRDDV